MAEPTKPTSQEPEGRADAPEREESPQGRETPSLGPRGARKKVAPLDGEPAIDRPYEPGEDKRKTDDAWQDPGGSEPGNG